MTTAFPSGVVQTPTDRKPGWARDASATWWQSPTNFSTCSGAG
nr:hypothetical protein [Nonomuraea candida]